MAENQSLSKISFETENEKTVFAVVTSLSEDIDYSEKWLDDQLVEYGCSGLNILQTAHEKIAELLADNKPGRVMLGNIIDASVNVELSDDFLSASLHIMAPEGGRLPITKELVEALNNKEISLNLVDKNKIAGLMKKALIIDPGESIDDVIVTGRAPKHGKDTQFKCLVEDVTDRRPNERDDGSVDYYDLGEIPSVEVGCELMALLEPVPGVDGLSVTGHELKARVAKKLKFRKCKGAETSPTDPELLISNKKGQSVINNRGVAIENVHTGHIEYDGTLVVKGDVTSGMKINVTGDVQVFGLVNDACIEAGGNIDLKLGAIGNAGGLGEKIHINCKGNLYAGQLESVSVKVNGDVFIKSRISNCHVNAGHQVIVGNRFQDKSGIVGGHITAGSVIRTETLGSAVGALTAVNIACGDEVLERLDLITQEITYFEEILVKLVKLAVGLAKKQTEEEKKLLAKVKSDIKEIKAKVNSFISEKYEIEAAIERTSNGKIIVQKETYPGVTVKIVHKEKTVKSRYGQGAFLLVDNILAFNSAIS